MVPFYSLKDFIFSAHMPPSGKCKKRIKHSFVHQKRLFNDVVVPYSSKAASVSLLLIPERSGRDIDCTVNNFRFSV